MANVSKRRAAWAKLRWTQKGMIIGVSLAVIGLCLTAFASLVGPHYTSADKTYLSTARSALPNRSDSARISVGKSICNALVAGGSTAQIFAVEVQNGVDSGQAGSLISAAEIAYCPNN